MKNNSMDLVISDKYAAALAQNNFLVRHHPVMVGTIAYTASGIAYRRGFALDPNVPRVFIAGGAGDSGSYEWKSTGISYEMAKAKSFEFGAELAKRGITVVTGYTPKGSISHEAARGAKSERGIVIGIAPSGFHEAANLEEITKAYTGVHIKSPKSKIPPYRPGTAPITPSNGHNNGLIPGSEFDTSILKFYDLICGLGISSGNMFVDFAQRDLFNIKSAHLLAAFPGMRGTNDEVATYILMREGRPLYLITGLGGVPDIGKDYFKWLHTGKTVLFDGHQHMSGLAQTVLDDARQTLESLRSVPSFFVNNIIVSGVPMKISLENKLTD